MIPDNLDYDKPIIADGFLILLPCITDNYTILGYNWFNLNSFIYNSSRLWVSKQYAVQAYSHHDIRNISFNLKKPNGDSHE